jgi:ATP-dependent DNA ligase
VTRPSLLDYCGAGARLAPERGCTLPPKVWAWQPKIDGCYARATLDNRGRILRVVSRSGEPIPQAADLIGILAGPPDSVLHGELEAHTEAGIRAAATRGWAALHLFDVSRLDGATLERLPYADRYGALHRAQAQLECDGDGRRATWTEDATGRAHGASGRFVAPIPRDLRRLPIVPMARGPGAGEMLWRSHVEVGGGEGLVAVRLDAPLRMRGSKRKIKATDTLDAVCVASSRGGSTLTYAGQSFTVGTECAVGAIVEVAHDGWYEAAAVPRFPRVVRRRDDLATTAPA